ncbi:unnamed protein product [Macrosiphum euphorbiae]|uniref:DUF5641 domain-containing protein n=1 Tax=Macrosiphum euphorbiae TaxID=13131 RepID=A0AAV0X093_9HEMI|nr:unnamed protein product [Macrosiphum euphorbiae]
MSLGQLVTDFNNEQKHILSTLAETDEVDKFVEVDENVTETMQSMCDQINVIVAKLKQNTSMPTPCNDRKFASQRCNVLENVGSSLSINCVKNNEKTVGKTTTKKIQGKRSEKTSGHTSNACPTSFTCRTCSSKHSTLLHLTDDTTKSSTTKTNDNSERATTSCNATQFSGVTHTETTVLLGTVVVRVRDNTGVLQEVRAVLDSGSQVSAVTVDCVNRLGLTRRKCPVEVIGLSQQPVNTVKGQTNFNFFSVQYDVPEFKVTNVIVLPRIMSSMPNRVLPAEIRDRYRHLVLADPRFDHPAPVDMLIGGDLYPSVMQSRADVIHTEGLPSAMNTQLGWVIIGALQNNTHTPLTSLSISTTPPIEELMQRFWTVEEPTESTMPTTQDKQCEDCFVKTTKRDATGRFYVGLPFRTIVCSPDTTDIGCQDKKSVVLGSSRTSALNRLYNSERRLEKDSALYTAYRAFMDDYRALGHMNLGVGDVVVINSPSRPPLMWQLGRVIDVHPGADQVVRVATIKTAEGILKRPVVKLVKLPTDNA